MGITRKEYRAKWYRDKRAEAKIDRTCDWCGVSISHMRSDARWCSRPCANAGIKRERRARGIQEWRESNFSRRLRKYGLEASRFEQMFADQEGRCAICSVEFTHPEYTDVHVDHCHDSGAVRGLLCNGCNVGIGMLKDDPDRLLSAAAYLLTNENAVAVPGGFA